MSKYPVQPFFGFKAEGLRPYSKDVKGERYYPTHGKYAYGSKLPLVLAGKKPLFKKLYNNIHRFPQGNKLVRWGESVIVNVVPWKKPMQPLYPQPYPMVRRSLMV